MRVRSLRSTLLDSLRELVGIKSGLALSSADVTQYLKLDDSDDAWWSGEALEPIGVRAERLERSLCCLLSRVGAIADQRSSTDIAYEFAATHADDLLEAVPDESGGLELPPRLEMISKISSVIAMAAAEIHHPMAAELEAHLTALPGWDTMLSDYRHRHLMNRSLPEIRQWDGVRPLSDLFDLGRDGSDDAEPYFDQRFIDFLHRNIDQLAGISWRQFERLCAEYFSRLGYSVELGPGSKDGGRDVRAISESDIGPELIVIQCRRYSVANPVGVDAMRSFWSTVQDDGATRGLIATTSRLTAGAMQYCEARRYRLSVAEGHNVERWIASMSAPTVTHKF